MIIYLYYIVKLLMTTVSSGDEYDKNVDSTKDSSAIKQLTELLFSHNCTYNIFVHTLLMF